MKFKTLILCLCSTVSVWGQVLSTCPEGDASEDPNLQTEELFLVVEQMPMFAGCEELNLDDQKSRACAGNLMTNFIYDHIRYPEAAIEQRTHGTVVVSFIVEKEGCLSNIKIQKDIGNGCGAAAQRVIAQMPNFIAGMQRGRKVRVKYNIPVKFHPNRLTLSEEVYQEALKDAKQNTLFGKIDSDPRFPGCEGMASETGRYACAGLAVQKFINKHLKYPEAAIERALEGTVVVAFTVEKNGKLSNIRTIEDIGGGCGEEVERIVAKMPKWKPARRANKKIVAEHEVAVDFSLAPQ